MSYNKTTWNTGDTITAEKLNNLESGVENANSSGIMVLTETIENDIHTLTNTWQEIHDAIEAGTLVIMPRSESQDGETLTCMAFAVCYMSQGYYIVDITNVNDPNENLGNLHMLYGTDSASGYPTIGGNDISSN